MDDSQFGIELRQLVVRRAASDHLVDTLAFVTEVADRLQEDPAFGEMILADDTRQLSKSRQSKIHGFSALDESDRSISVVVGKWNDDPEAGRLSTAEIDQMRGWLENFVSASLNDGLDQEITESSPAYELATTLRSYCESISCIRLHVLSNQLLSKGYRRESRSIVSGVPTELHIWDLSRLKAVYLSSREREMVQIELADFGTAGIPCIQASKTESLSSYLCVVDGDVLANLFEHFGSRLLEGNVRSFLGMKGGVNKGIRGTIQDAPELFFAYNNGIAATAASATVEMGPFGTRVTSISDLQIVNGGQTTASILRARRQDRLSLAQVSVPMKLTIIGSNGTNELVPKIAEYANTQNKVAIADFFANHPVHRRMEEISRRMMVPARADTRVQSKWFYERARGQYQNERMYLTGAGKTKFDLEFPASQVINKTDLAKFDSVLDGKPHWVALGAQKNFIKFAGKFSSKRDKSDAQYWDEISPNYGDGYYQRVAAMALLWKAGEAAVSIGRGTWYEGDYKPQIVAYAWSMIFHSIRSAGREPNLVRVWERQEADLTLMKAFTRAAVMAQSAIKDLPEGSSNVGEWAKKEACWTKLSSTKFALGEAVLEWSIDTLDERDRKRQARAEGNVDDSITLQQDVVLRASNGYWRALYSWPSLRRHISAQDLILISRAVSAQSAASIVGERDLKRLRSIVLRCEQEGFRQP